MTKQTKNGALTSKDLKNFEKDFNRRPENQAMMNAVTRTNLQEVALNRRTINELSFAFSDEVEFVGPITDQMRAGTCWLFAELNWLKWHTAKKHKLENFEFSQNQVIFWNKLEKSNYFLENIIELRDKPWDDRKVYHLLDNPVPDGGEWHMLADIIDKYGLIPKTAMPDTWNREKSPLLNKILNYRLRKGAAELRAMHQAGKPVEALREKKMEIMKDIYRINAILLGEPPHKFDFVYKDKDKKIHVDRNLTGRDFYDKYVGVDTKDMFCLMSVPTPETPYNRPLSADFFGNTVGGRSLLAANIPMKELKYRALRVLSKKEPCLFSADVTQDSHSKLGLLHTNLYDFDLIFDAPFDMDQQTRIHTLQTRLTHCMVFIGVDLVDGEPKKWKIENSWGEQFGKKGIFLMSDAWFDEHVYALIIHKKFLTKKILEIFDKEPVVLPPWHPMV